MAYGGGIALLYLVVYIFFYDKSYYHIDNVREWMVRFLFFESMLLGAYFKKNEEKFCNKFFWWLLCVTVVIFIIYFASKMFLSNYPSYSNLQIINQAIIFVLLYFIFRLFASLDEKLLKMPTFIKKCISYIASITLEIYVVQSVLIDLIRPYFGFPLNWLAITLCIVLSASVLHFVCKYIIRGIEFTIKKIRAICKKNKGEQGN